MNTEMKERLRLDMSEEQVEALDSMLDYIGVYPIPGDEGFLLDIRSIIEAETKLAEEIVKEIDVGFFHIVSRDNILSGKVEAWWLIRGKVGEDGIMPLIMENLELADTAAASRLAAWHAAFVWWSEQDHKEGK